MSNPGIVHYVNYKLYNTIIKIIIVQIFLVQCETWVMIRNQHKVHLPSAYQVS